VHFLRFELEAPMREALARGVALALGIDHPRYQASVQLPAEVRAALCADLR
jgi:hypothetical protein